MKKLLIGPLFLLLASCVSIDTTIELSGDGSGQISLTYTVSQMVANLGSVDKGWQKLPLPINEADFRRQVSQSQGLTLRSFSKSEDAQNVTIKAVLAFSDVAALNRFYSAGENEISLSQSGNDTVYRQVIFQGFPDGVDQQTRDFAAAFFKDYHLTFQMKAPRQIKSASAGTVSSDRRSVTFDMPVLQLLDQKTPLVWTVTW
ncbi:hypothetical protein [Salinispira pacifica]